MQQGMPIRYIIYIFSMVLLLYAGIRVIEMRVGFELSNSLENSWKLYRVHTDEKINLREELVAQLGFTGLIHNYFNFILRDGDEIEQLVWVNFGALGETIQHLKNISNTIGEASLLEDIEEVVVDLQNKMSLIKELKSQGLRREEIVKRVDIDYNKISDALTILKKSYVVEGTYERSKSELNSQIKWRLGFNGMIRNFKLFVISGEQRYYDNVQRDVEKVMQYIKEYKDLDITLGEKLALQGIENTVLEYHGHLDTIKILHEKKVAVKDIDKQIIVDNYYAIRGFSLLETALLEQVYHRTESVYKVIDALGARQKNSFYIDIFFLITMFLALNAIMIKLIMIPVQQISYALSRLSVRDLSVALDGEPLISEMLSLYNVFKVFKGYELERSVSEAGLKEMASTDQLTGLTNRAYLSKHFNEIIRRSVGYDKNIGVMLIDLDNFKTVNDELGHSTGDMVLEQVSDIFITLSNDKCLIARTGGDEFVIVVDDCEDEAEVEKIAQSILSSIDQCIIIPNSNIKVGASIGICIEKAKKEVTLEKCLVKADRAMYMAKEAGKNTYKVYPRLNEPSV